MSETERARELVEEIRQLMKDRHAPGMYQRPSAVDTQILDYKLPKLLTLLDAQESVQPDADTDGWTLTEWADALESARLDLLMCEDYDPDDIAAVMEKCAGLLAAAERDHRAMEIGKFVFREVEEFGTNVFDLYLHEGVLIVGSGSTLRPDLEIPLSSILSAEGGEGGCDCRVMAPSPGERVERFKGDDCAVFHEPESEVGDE